MVLIICDIQTFLEQDISPFGSSMFGSQKGRSGNGFSAPFSFNIEKRYNRLDGYPPVLSSNSVKAHLL